MEKTDWFMRLFNIYCKHNRIKCWLQYSWVLQSDKSIVPHDKSPNDLYMDNYDTILITRKGPDTDSYVTERDSERHKSPAIL